MSPLTPEIKPLDLLNSLGDIETVKNVLGEAASGEFGKTCAIFALAAYVHAKQVRKEIKTQFGELVSVLRADLEAQKTTLGALSGRVGRIEKTLQIKE